MKSGKKSGVCKVSLCKLFFKLYIILFPSFERSQLRERDQHAGVEHAGEQNLSQEFWVKRSKLLSCWSSNFSRLMVSHCPTSFPNWHSQYLHVTESRAQVKVPTLTLVDGNRPLQPQPYSSLHFLYVYVYVFIFSYYLSKCRSFFKPSSWNIVSWYTSNTESKSPDLTYRVFCSLDHFHLKDVWHVHSRPRVWFKKNFSISRYKKMWKNRQWRNVKKIYFI